MTLINPAIKQVINRSLRASVGIHPVGVSEENAEEFTDDLADRGENNSQAHFLEHFLLCLGQIPPRTGKSSITAFLANAPVVDIQSVSLS